MRRRRRGPVQLASTKWLAKVHQVADVRKSTGYPCVSIVVLWDAWGTGYQRLQDLLYLDKNADVGVSWRKAGPFERFSEVR